MESADVHRRPEIFDHTSGEHLRQRWSGPLLRTQSPASGKLLCGAFRSVAAMPSLQETLISLPIRRIKRLPQGLLTLILRVCLTGAYSSRCRHHQFHAACCLSRYSSEPFLFAHHNACACLLVTFLGCLTAGCGWVTPRSHGARHPLCKCRFFFVICSYGY